MRRVVSFSTADACSPVALAVNGTEAGARTGAVAEAGASVGAGSADDDAIVAPAIAGLGIGGA